MFITPIVIAGALYVAPRAIESFCTTQIAIHPRIDRLRERIANLADAARAELGEKKWYVITDMLAKNAWISFLITAYLTRNRNPFETLNDGIETVTCFFAFSMAVGFVKVVSRIFFQTS